MDSERTRVERASTQAPTVLDELRRSTAAAVVRAVLVDGPLARADIADRIGMTRATVTRATAQLIELGVLRESAPRRTQSGRPRVPLEIDDTQRAVLTVHFGAQEARVGVVTILGEVLSEVRHRYTDPDPGAVSVMIASALEDALSAAQGRTILGLSASIGAWVDPANAHVVECPPLGWHDVPLSALVPDLGLPRYFDQTTRGLALAEGMLGAARGFDDFIDLWCGNVLGAAFVQNGEVRRGARGGAGFIDHLQVGVEGELCSCGRRTCLASTATDDAVVQKAIRRGILRPSGSLRTLLRVVADGDEGARQLVHEHAAVMGRAAGQLADLQAPEMVVVSGLITTAEGYRDAFAAAFAAASLRASGVVVVPSSFGDRAPTVASASFLLEAYFSDPLGFEAVARESARGR